MRINLCLQQGKLSLHAQQILLLVLRNQILQSVDQIRIGFCQLVDFCDIGWNIVLHIQLAGLVMLQLPGKGTDRIGQLGGNPSGMQQAKQQHKYADQ